MLSVQDVSAGYGPRRVLHGVSVQVEAGQFVGLIGPNGCGKTTLLRVISGVLAARSGQVLLEGVPLRSIARRELARTMACLSQDLSIGLPFTVREVAMMGRWPHQSRLGWADTRQDLRVVREVLKLADVSHLEDRPITEISGGERQRAFIAMCLAQQPRLLLLDEPMSHLDIGHQLSVLDLIARLNHQTGLTVVAVLHDLNLAAEYCQRLVVLDGGRVVAGGAPREVLTAELIRKVYAADVLTQANPVSGKPHVVVAAGMNHRGAGGFEPPQRGD